MGQITIYLDAETEIKLRTAAKAGNISQSKWVAELIREKVQDQWPQTIMAMAGTWSDFPDADDIRKSSGRDVAREGW